MSEGNIAVFGIYRTQLDVERAVDMLKSEGFGQADISVIMPSVESNHQFAHEKLTKAPEGATVGAGTGAMVGGALGWLVGIGALTIPGVGPLIAAGPIMAVFAGAGVGGAVGGITGALVGLGISEYEAKRYEGMVKDGGILLSIHLNSPNLLFKAKDVLKKTGAQDISSTDEGKGLRQGKDNGSLSGRIAS